MPGVDVLADLIEASWTPEGGSRISFPTTDFGSSFDHDIARHKYWRVNGASLEHTGRNPIRHPLTIPFRVGIVKGRSETWTALYPQTFDLFFAAASGGKRGFLSHPHFGLRRGFLTNLDAKWVGARRDGVDVTVMFEEDEDYVLEQSQADPSTALYRATLTLDTSAADLADLAPQLPKVDASLVDAANTIISAPRTAQLRAAGKASAVKGFARRMSNAVDSVAKTVDEAGDPDTRGPAIRSLLWPVVGSTTAIESAVTDVADVAKEVASRRRVATFVTRVRQTLAQIASDLGAPVQDVMSLNPRLLNRPVVPAGTSVRYYAT